MDTINRPPDRWLECPPFGELIEDLFLPTKTFLREDIDLPPGYQYTPRLFLDQMRERKIDVGLIINLSYSHRYYDSDEIQDEFNIDYKHIACRGHNEVPQPSEREEFLKVCNNFNRKKPNKVIAVHCTHGFNRTGFMICSYLCQEHDWDIAAAIEMFKRKRQPGIYKQDYINQLFGIYADSDDPIIQASVRPMWDSEEGLVDPSLSYTDIENNVTENSFYEGIHDVHLVRDIDLKCRIYRHCCSLCKFNQDTDRIAFPGAQPVSMDRTNIQFLRAHRYRISWKADGCRFMMYIQDEDNIFFLDRNLLLWRVTGLRFPKLDNLRSHITDTLLDGEMVTDVINGQSIPKYLIYDVISLNGNIVGNDNFDKRCGLIKCVIIKARHLAKQENLIMSEGEPFKVSEKGFFFLHHTKKTLDLEVPHEKDGLIFQPLNSPYTGGTCNNILKWKPPHLNSVDFRIVIREERRDGCLPESVAQLYVSNIKDRPMLSFRVGRDQVKNLNQYNNKIVEMVVQDRKWTVLRERTDKLRPNSYETANSVIKSIREPVTEEDLLKFVATIPQESKMRG